MLRPNYQISTLFPLISQFSMYVWDTSKIYRKICDFVIMTLIESNIYSFTENSLNCGILTFLFWEMEYFLIVPICQKESQISVFFNSGFGDFISLSL